MSPFSHFLSSLEKSTDGVCVLHRATLAERVTFRIGGEADLLLFPETREAFCTAILLADLHRIPLFVLGGGSNLLPSDDGFRGVVISTKKLNKIQNSGNYFSAECGVTLNSLIRRAEGCGLSGLEKLFGIPASVGGAVYMNAGAHGVSVSDCLVAVELLDRSSGARLLLARSDLAFAYRESRFQHDRNLIVLRAIFRFLPQERCAIQATLRRVSRLRRESQPLNLPSAGSVFRRPPEGEVWRFIDACGLRGYCVGGASVSEKHAGFIVNLGGATAQDVRALISLCEERVYAACRVRLVREIEFL